MDMPQCDALPSGLVFPVTCSADYSKLVVCLMLCVTKCVLGRSMSKWILERMNGLLHHASSCLIACMKQCVMPAPMFLEHRFYRQVVPWTASSLSRGSIGVS
eukprot:1158198-Pelagomonas_calceolata.AAC.1